jgi:hypothetical protein
LDELDENAMKILNFIGGVVLPKKDRSGLPTVFYDMTKFDLEQQDPTHLVSPRRPAARAF